MLEIIENYKLLKSRIPDIIEKSGYRNDFIAQKMGIKPNYFSVKKQRGNWTDSDVEKLLTAITTHHNDVQDILDEIKINGTKADKYLTAKEVKKIMQWK